MKAVKKVNSSATPKTIKGKVRTAKMPSKSNSKKAKRKNPVHISVKGQFTCETCGLVLSSEVYLLRHIQTRHPPEERSYICDFDGKGFQRKNTLRVHMERHQTSEIWTCDVCQRSYVCKIAFQRHLMTHIERVSCDLCNLVFKNKNILDRHKISVHNIVVSEFPCKLCTRIFPSQIVRNNHYYMAHKDNKPNLFKCIDCKLEFDLKEELRIHSFIHFNGKIHTCPECHQIFKKKTQMNLHMQKHDGVKFVCEECGDEFVYKTGLDKHIRKNRCKGAIKKMEDVMGDNEVENIARKQLEQMLNKVVETETAQATEKIQEIDRNLSYEDEEMVDDTTYVDNDVSEAETQSIDDQIQNRSTRTRQNRSDKNHTCDVCGLSVKFKSAMEKHVKQHMTSRISKNYQCEQCNEIYHCRKKLKDHYLADHKLKIESITAKYICEFDGRTFDTLCFYKNHMLSHSEQNRQFICVHCSAAFKTVGNLRRHEKTHADTRDFVCSQCPKSFKTSLSLKIHQDTVHVDTKIFVKCEVCATILQEKYLRNHMKHQHTEDQQIKRFHCSVCDREFKTAYATRRHLKTVHEPSLKTATFSCSECPDKKFFSALELRDHSFVHFTGEVFECAECGKMFKTKRILTVHQRSHQDIVYTCELCEMVSFKSRTGLRKHNQKCHGLS